MSGLIINRRAIVWVTAFSALTVLALMFAEVNGLLPEPSLDITITQAISFSVVFAIIGILLYLAV
jgi:hypothetical protein